MSAPAGASTVTSKATAQMMEAHRTECRALTRDTKKEVPPSSPSPLHKYRQVFSLATGRLHQSPAKWNLMKYEHVGFCISKNSFYSSKESCSCGKFF